MAVSGDIYSELTWRGLIHQSTDPAALPAWLMAAPRTLYAGFDPTSDSLHVGHLVPLLYLRRFQRAGHLPIAVVGGATGMIGDPSGKSDERNLLSAEVLQANVERMEQQMRRYLDFDGPAGARLLNNFDWFRQFSFLDFLRDVGKNSPISVMLSRDSVKSRLDSDSGLSYTEFSYMLLQAYDFVYLNEHYGCQLQVGGSDQWGNITSGIDLGRRMRGVQLYGITCPLLLKSDGSKMGKTEKGALWLDPARTSPYAFYQYWLNVSDQGPDPAADEVGRCLRTLTDLPREEIESLDALRDSDPRQRQRRLAQALTELVHGAEGLAAAERATSVLHDKAAIEENWDDRQLLEIFAEVPSAQAPRSRLEEGLPLVDAFCLAQLANSKGEARRLAQQGGAYVNNKRIDDVELLLTSQHLASPTVIVLRAGRKRYGLLRFE